MLNIDNASVEAPACFVGRLKELSTLRRHFVLDAQRLVSLCGRAGVGKTALARHFLNASQSDFAARHYVLHRHGAAIGDVPGERTPSGQKSLLVVDDADGIDAETLQAFKLFEQEHASTAGLSILLISRRPLDGFLERAPVIQLGPLDSCEWVDAIRPNLDTDDAGIADCFYRYVRGDPAMLGLAVSCIANHGVTLRALRDCLRAFYVPGIVHRDGRPCASSAGIPQSAIEACARIQVKLREQYVQQRVLVDGRRPTGGVDLIAPLLSEHGYEMDTPPANARCGLDIYHARSEQYESFLFCVRFARQGTGNRAQVSVVRAIYGTVHRFRGTASLVVQISVFSHACEVQRQVRCHLGVRDYLALRGWISTVRARTDMPYNADAASEPM